VSAERFSPQSLHVGGAGVAWGTGVAVGHRAVVDPAAAIAQMAVLLLVHALMGLPWHRGTHRLLGPPPRPLDKHGAGVYSNVSAESTIIAAHFFVRRRLGRRGCQMR
jgi:hypothetical protein